jgi:hypothetical protein
MPLSYIRIVIPTVEVNHTALYKACEKLPDDIRAQAKLNNFAAMYHTIGYQGKDKSSREHDEVISRCTKALGLATLYIDHSTKKSSTRYVVVYQKYRNEEEQIIAAKQVADYLKHFTRRPEVRETIQLEEIASYADLSSI